MSQESLAERLGVSRVTVIRWENGTAKPSGLAASRLEAIGFGPVSVEETNIDEIPRIRMDAEQLMLFGEVKSCCGAAPLAVPTVSIQGRDTPVRPASYVQNGPRNQTSFFDQLFRLQGMKQGTNLTPAQWADRLSAVQSVPGLGNTTAQHRLERPKPRAAHWNPNYGSHGWHRYIGRFPPHLVRALLNHFQATKETLVCDPFCGSGTTLVECRLLGIPAVGIEICPLSALISRVKSTFPSDVTPLISAARNLSDFYQDRWDAFVRGRNIEHIAYGEITARQGNLLALFPNSEKWLTRRALLGTSIVLEFAHSQEGYIREAILLALSSKMRSIGNVDVDVARAEYSASPRLNVDVNAHVQAAIAKMCDGIEASVLSHEATIGPPDDVAVLHEDVLQTNLPPSSIAHVITSPPYGVEASSYLRAHLLSYRCLHPFLGEDPYEFGDRVIGSEYVRNTDTTTPDHSLGSLSREFRMFFDKCLAGEPPARIVTRAHMMMQFFADIAHLVSKMFTWLVPGGKVAFVIGNKRIGDHLVPTDKIVTDIFANQGFKATGDIRHKLKCNNTNSQVPWQERIIQEEYVLFFESTKGTRQ